MSPNVISCNAAISACEKHSEWVKALELLSRMAKDKVETNTITYNAAISACEKGGQLSKALELLSTPAALRVTFFCFCLWLLACCWSA